MWIHPIMAHLDQCSSLHRGLWLCPSPLETTLHTAAARILFQSEFYLTNSSLPESQILIFKVLQSSSWSVPVTSLSHPFPFSSPKHTQLQSPWFCLLLNHTGTILGAFTQGLLITEHFPGPRWPPYPHQSLSSQHSSWPGIGFFPCLYCVSPF